MENSQTCSKGVSSEIYHHVTIRNDLAEVKKCYDDEIRQDKVPEKFWIEQFRRTTNQPTESSVEICFGRINGPCEFDFTFFFLSLSLKTIIRPVTTAFTAVSIDAVL